MEILCIAIIYLCSLARWCEVHPHKESKKYTRPLYLQGPTFQGQGDAQVNYAFHI